MKKIRNLRGWMKMKEERKYNKELKRYEIDEDVKVEKENDYKD